ncbi:MAG TPA: DegT/DnrJ/EryC1/StrS family aminotransferase [Limnochordia bacterium]
MSAETLAVDGGPPVRTAPFPPRRPFDEREERLLLEAVRSQNLFGKSGKMVPEFERRFAAFYGRRFAQSCTSGTAAIHVAVGAVNPDPGDEIITAPITDPGSVMPILQQNAVPVFADVDPRTLNMTPESIEANITERTRAIILVHLFGRPAPVEAVWEIAQRHNLVLIEDCSQCHATQRFGKFAGTTGHIAAFSLQQSKQMTTGDGGMAITDDEALYVRMKLFSDKGWDYKYMGERDHAFLAPNYRMTELQAAVGIAQLEKVRDVSLRRHALGQYLCDLLAGVPGIETLPAEPETEVSWWNFIFHVRGFDPDEFCRRVRAEGVPLAAHYIGDPIFLRGAFLIRKVTYGRSSCPWTCGVGARPIEYTRELVPGAVAGLESVVVFGLHEHMSEADIEDVARAVRKVATAMAR